MDHSYSRAPIKEELEWFSEYQNSSHAATTSSKRTQNAAPISLTQATNSEEAIIDEVQPQINDDQTVFIENPGTSESIPSVCIKIESTSDEEDYIDPQNFLQQEVFEEITNTEEFSFQKEHNYTRPYPVDFLSENSTVAESKEESRRQSSQSRRGRRKSGRPPTDTSRSEDNSKPIKRRPGRPRISNSPRRSLRLIRPKIDLANLQQSENRSVFLLKFANPSDIDILTKASQEQNELCPDLSVIGDTNILSKELGNDTEIRGKIISPNTLPNTEILKAVPSIPSIVLSKKNVVTLAGSENESSKQMVLVPFVNKEGAVEILQEPLETVAKKSILKTRDVTGKIRAKPLRKVALKPIGKPAKMDNKQDEIFKKLATGTLRVKTQDELNALAGGPLTPSSKKLYVVVGKSSILPIDRSLMPVSKKWREKLNITGTNVALSSTKLSKDITGKRIKNTNKESLKNPPTDGTVQNSLLRRSSRIIQNEIEVEKNKDGIPVDFESCLSKFIVTHPIPLNESTLVQVRKPRRTTISEIGNQSKAKQKVVSRFKVAVPVKPIVERVDNIIKDVLAGADDMKEVGVLRVSLTKDTVKENDNVKDVVKTQVELPSPEALTQNETGIKP